LTIDDCGLLRPESWNAMKVLIANIGSTSFKFKLFDMPSEQVQARGGIERIGGEGSAGWVELDDNRVEFSQPVADHGAAIEIALEHLADSSNGVLKSSEELEMIGFKAVYGHRLGGVQIVDDAVLEAMESYNAAAPAHNPAYVAAMRMFEQVLPNVTQVAVFETGFHEDIPLSRQLYGLPYEWCEQYGIRRYGFHGASHRYISWRVADLVGRDDLKVISCHLGGSSSLCAISAGRSIATSMGFSPQSGLPQSNRAGDVDPFAFLVLKSQTGKSIEELLEIAGNNGGLLGISGVSNDLRDIEQAASEGNERAGLALENYVEYVRHYLGAYVVALGGPDLLAFTGGIGENSATVREMVCNGLEFLGIQLDREVNRQSRGSEQPIHAAGSKVQIWTIPTNEELVVAKLAYEKVVGS